MSCETCWPSSVKNERSAKLRHPRQHLRRASTDRLVQRLDVLAESTVPLAGAMSIVTGTGIVDMVTDTHRRATSKL